MRLIDADALTDRMYHDAFETDTDMQKWDSGCWIRYKMFENAIDDAPTIEPKRGEWIKQGISPYEGIQRCSVCNDIYDITEEFNFCPNCGADMRKESE